MDYEAQQLQRKGDPQPQTERDRRLLKEQVLTPDPLPKLDPLFLFPTPHLKEQHPDLGPPDPYPIGPAQPYTPCTPASSLPMFSSRYSFLSTNMMHL